LQLKLSVTFEGESGLRSIIFHGSIFKQNILEKDLNEMLMGNIAKYILI